VNSFFTNLGPNARHRITPFSSRLQGIAYLSIAAALIRRSTAMRRLLVSPRPADRD
jgi:hypothetical protein